LLPRKPQQ
jgi:hypothetical protein